MPRPDVDRYQDGDHVTDAAGNRGRVTKCFSKAKRRHYLRVQITAGPRKGEWEWPERFDLPVLDWTPDGLDVTCPECERRFRTGFDESGLQRILCRQCERRQQGEDQRRAQESSPSHAYGMRRRLNLFAQKGER